MASEKLETKLDKDIQAEEKNLETVDHSPQDLADSLAALAHPQALAPAESGSSHEEAYDEEADGETLEEKLVAAIEDLERKLEKTTAEMTTGITKDDIIAEPEAIKADGEMAPADLTNPDPRLGKVRATPAARRIAREYKVDIQKMIGSGPNGRIQVNDVKKRVIIRPGEFSYESMEPVVIGSVLEEIRGNPENVLTEPPKQSRKKIKEMNQKIEKMPNPALDFVPFVEDSPEPKDADVVTKISELDFVPFVDLKAEPLRDEIIVKPTPLHPPTRKKSEADKTTTNMNTIKADNAATENIKAETTELAGPEIKSSETAEPVNQSETIAKKAENEMTRTGKRKMIADQMVKSNLETAVITLTTEIDMSEVKALRKKITKKIEEQTKYRCTYTDFLLMASARALMKHPIINSSLMEQEVRINPFVHLGLSVDMEDGLIVPVIKNAQQLNFVEMVKSRGELLKAIKNKQVVQDDLSGSTFTITNLGMYGIREFTAIINQPNSAILSVGEVVQRIRVHNGEPVVRSVMKISLNLDHRVADGMAGAKFLQEIKADMENPSLLLF